MRSTSFAVATLTGLVLLAGPTAALTDAQKCEATKLKRAGQYNFCRLKAAGRAIKTGDPVDYTTCDGKFFEKWAAAELIPSCPTSGDDDAIQAQVAADADFIKLKLAGTRFVDNGNGTVTDTQTGLMWEQKDDLGGVHDKDNTYSWCADVAPFDFACDNGGAPRGSAFTAFLEPLNNGTSADGTTISGCFAGHCDWRLPTIAELQTIVLAPYPCDTDPCIDPIFGAPQSGYYWTATTDAGNPLAAWYVEFYDASMASEDKTYTLHVRAVRSL